MFQQHSPKQASLAITWLGSVVRLTSVLSNWWLEIIISIPSFVPVKPVEFFVYFTLNKNCSMNSTYWQCAIEKLISTRSLNYFQGTESSLQVCSPFLNNHENFSNYFTLFLWGKLEESFRSTKLGTRWKNVSSMMVWARENLKKSCCSLDISWFAVTWIVYLKFHSFYIELSFSTIQNFLLSHLIPTPTVTKNQKIEIQFINSNNEDLFVPAFVYWIKRINGNLIISILYGFLLNRRKQIVVWPGNWFLKNYFCVTQKWKVFLEKIVLTKLFLRCVGC